MIGGVVRHGRTRCDARNLGRHLLKDSNEVEVINSAATNLDDVMEDMRIARDASRAHAAFLHIYLSPRRDMSRDELRQAAEIALKHFDAEDHPAALIFHDKPRRSGEGGSHLHIVVGRVNADGQVLPAGFEKIRLETACRIIEHDMKEQPTLGRHHASAIRWCRNNNREDIAKWLETTYGRTPQKPRSTMSPNKRQCLERQGIDHVHIRASVTAAWSASDNPQAFANILAEQGLSIAPGQKHGVFIVSQGETEIGSLERIIKEQRKLVAQRMEGFEYVTTTESRPKRANEASTLERGGHRSHETAPSSIAPGRDGPARGRPNRTNSERYRERPVEPTAVAPVARRPSQQNRRVERAQAVQTLRLLRPSAETTAAAELRTTAIPHPVTRHESLSAARQIGASPARGWDRIRELADSLMQCARSTYYAAADFRMQQQVPKAQERPRDTLADSQRDKEPSTLLKDTAAGDAEAAEVLKRKDHDLYDFVGWHLDGDQCRRHSKEYAPDIVTSLPHCRVLGRQSIESEHRKPEEKRIPDYLDRFSWDTYDDYAYQPPTPR